MILYLSILILLINAIQVQASGGLVGITNFNMYSPHPCVSSCTSYLSDLKLDCSTFDSEGEVDSSSDCLANSEFFMNSLAWCWEIQCANVSATISPSELIKAWNKNVPNATLTFYEALQLRMPNKTLPLNSTELNYSALVNPTDWHDQFRTDSDFLRSEVLHAQMALSLVMISWSLVLFGMLYNCLEKFHLEEVLIPKKLRIWFRKYLLYPALFKEKCSVPIRLSEGIPIDYIPPRLISLTIFCYYVINLIFCCVPYDVYYNNLNWPHDKASQLYSYVGNRTGVLSFANFPVIILFASRNNVFQWLTGWSFATFQHFHRHVSIICCLEAFIHSVLYTIKYVKKPNSAHLYAVEASEAYFWWGVLATVALCLMPVLAILWIRLKSYELFLFGHYVLGILTFLGCAYHIKERYSTEWGYNYWLYAAYAVWGFDYLARVLRIIYLKYKGGCSSKCVVELIDKESRTIKLTYNAEDSTQNCAGNYYFLYFHTLFPFYTSHPFTVSEWGHSIPVEKNSSSDSENDGSEKENINHGEAQIVSGNHQLIFYVQCLNGTTNKIYSKLEAKKFNPTTIPSLLEGPYGSYEKGIFHDYDFVLLLTGGIGNTVTLNYVQSFIDYKTHSCFPKSNVKLSVLHCDRYQNRLGFLDKKLDSMIPEQSQQDVEIQLHNTASGGRLRMEEYLCNKVKEIETTYPYGTRRIAVVSCGPAKFSDVIRKEVVEMQEKVLENTVVSYNSDQFDW